MKSVFTFLFLVFTICLDAQSGIKDNTFGNYGTASVDVPNLGTFVKSIVIQNDGKILVGGSNGKATDNYGVRTVGHSVLARFSSEGIVDKTFGTNGSIRFTFNDIRTNDEVNSISLQKDGKILAAGYVDILDSVVIKNQNLFRNRDYAITRLNQNGIIDSSFGKNGKISYHIVNDNKITGIKILSDDKILLSCYSYDSILNKDYYNLTRLLPTGSIDSSFGNKGIAEILKGNFFDEMAPFVVLADGNIITASCNYSYGSNVSEYFENLNLNKFLKDGKIDSTFQNGIKPISDPFNSNLIFSHPTAMLVQSDGKIVVTGNLLSKVSFSSLSTEIFIIQFNADGSIDKTFGTDGLVVKTSLPKYSLNYNPNLVIQSDGKLFVTAANVIFRFDKNGVIDKTFGYGGQYTFDTNNSDGKVLLLQSNNKILVSYGNFKQFYVERYFTGLNLGTIDFTLANQILVSPNPIAQSAELKYTLLEDETVTIQLFDVQGKLVKVFKQNTTQIKGEHVENLNFETNLVAGNYILNVSSPKGSVSVKVIKQ